MGQYWKPVNLDKREFIHPHALGAGLKLWEQLANSPGVGAALIILTAAMPETRGGGDFDLEKNWHGPERKFPEHNTTPGPMPEGYPTVAARTIGRWAGDRIALVGDYGEIGDLPGGEDAGEIYHLCVEAEYQDPDVDPAKAFTDITADVAQVIAHELKGEFQGKGWKTWKAED